MITLSLRQNEDLVNDANIIVKNTVDELGINLDQLTLDPPSIEKPDLTEKRLFNYATLVRILNHEEFNSFYENLGVTQKEGLQSKNSYEKFINPRNNLTIFNQDKQEEICSYLAIKKAQNPQEIHELIIDPNFLKSKLIKCKPYDLVLLQSLLMHNPQGIEALKDLVDLTAEQDEKKNTILKNVAISSLINPNLHDKAKQIFDKFDLAEFNDQNKESITNSLTFLSAQIEKSIAENQDDKLLKQFDIFVKALQIYGNKLDLTIEIPENIMDAIKARTNLELALPNKMSDQKASPNYAKDVLSGDIGDQIILKILKKQETEIRGASATPASDASQIR